VPKGAVTKHRWENSKAFPGTVRDYWVYVPAQYRPDGPPACVMVFQDGGGYVDVGDRGQHRVPVVFDNLIHKGEMPVTVGVFVNPGKFPTPGRPEREWRSNRSFEYDTLSDQYARFLESEILPEVGKNVKLRADAAGRAICGISSGGICAFTAAWERPDAFRRVFSAIGTYVGLRGGNNYPTLVRKFEPKPIRVFLQDGSGDLNIYGGDWWMANQEMERALKFAGYEVNHAWGTGGHNGQHATDIFPDAMRWLWKDWPNPVKAGGGSPQLKEIVLPGEGWQLVADGYRFTEGPAANAKGEVFFNDIPNSKTYKVGPDGKEFKVMELTFTRAKKAAPKRD
jgi:enterochelin esterase-like enzyme